MLLVTGGTGFVGSHLLDCLVALGCRVRCLVGRGSASADLPSAVEPVSGELLTGEGLAEALRGVETVFHAAGEGTENLVRAAAGVGRFVHLSSLLAAGPAPDAACRDEQTEPRPLSRRGRSMLEAERVVQGSPLANRAVILRPAVVYGPRDRALLPLFRAVRRGLLPRIGREERYFSVVYIRDLVEGLAAAARVREAAGRTYYLAHPEQVSWGKLGSLAAALMGRSTRTVSLSPGAARLAALGAECWARLRGHPAQLTRDQLDDLSWPNWTCDATRAHQELGFTAATELRDGLTETLAWYREAGWLRA